MAQRLAIRIDLGPAVPLALASRTVQDISVVCDLAVNLDRQSETNRLTQISSLQIAERLHETTSLIRSVQDQLYDAYRLSENPEDSADDGLRFRLPPIDDIRAGARASTALDRLMELAYDSLDLQTVSEAPSADVQARALLSAEDSNQYLVPTVLEIRYTNPLEIILTGITWGSIATVSGGSLWALLKFIRDFGPKRAQDRALAQKTYSEATRNVAEAEVQRARAFQIRTEAECKAQVTRALLDKVQSKDILMTPEQLSQLVNDQSVGAILELTRSPVEFQDVSDD
jgi:hypothetical protein